QVMLQEALQQAGAAQYERTDARKAHRNGYKDRSLKTRYGETILRKPQFREFPFETQVFGRYARVEKALVNAVVESYLQGVSTRKIQEIVSHLGIDPLSHTSSWMPPPTKYGTEHDTSPKRSWWSPASGTTATGRSWELGSPTVRMKNSGRDCSRSSKNGDSPGFNWSSRMGIPASRRRLKPPSSVHPGRCVRFIVPGPS